MCPIQFFSLSRQVMVGEQIVNDIFIALKITKVRKKQVSGMETVPLMALYPSHATYSTCAQLLLGLSEETESSMLVHHPC